MKNKRIVGIYIFCYSSYVLKKLARGIIKGTNSVEGAEAKFWQVAETFPPEILGKFGAPP